MTAKGLYQKGLLVLEQQGIEDAGFDALQLFEHHTGMNVSGLLAFPEKEIGTQQE